VKVFIFTGPSLPRPAARALWREPAYLAPVAQGDVYRVASRKPAAIGIIDGFFERLPAVWHKEILWALSKGIRVYGSSSMGALRAAELSAYGMIGVGSVYEGYASGALTDDDEVTLAHAPAANKYRAVSEPMVNIRCTLAQAAAAAIVSQPTADALARIAKALFYPLRNYEKIIEEGLRAHLPAEELRNLRAWLPTGRIDQKRLDAIALLTRMREDLRHHSPAQPPNFEFQNTLFWVRLRRNSRASRSRRKS